MALGTFSKFYYGWEITTSNNKIDFGEGGAQLTATLTSGVYNSADLAAEIKLQMEAVGAKTYTVTFSRTTRKFTIAANSGTYELKITSGTNILVSSFSLLGFTGADLTGVITYTGDSVSGSEYKPQFWLQDYVSPTNWLEKTDVTVNETTTGQVETIIFSDSYYTEFNILFITNLAMDGQVIKNDSAGVSNANSFMQFLIKRGPVEFMPDENTVSTFYSITLDTTELSNKGTSYRLKEETSKNLPNVYQTGRLKFRVV